MRQVPGEGRVVRRTTIIGALTVMAVVALTLGWASSSATHMLSTVKPANAEKAHWELKQGDGDGDDDDDDDEEALVASDDRDEESFATVTKEKSSTLSAASVAPPPAPPVWTNMRHTPSQRRACMRISALALCMLLFVAAIGYAMWPKGGGPAHAGAHAPSRQP
mmetsp:Transcript_10920/g.28594  ORF Transcript_10920/g.28594 Transcript_10920/m.28594 type:complete len:164 (-) Transcript_10920:278-769(-)